MDKNTDAAALLLAVLVTIVGPMVNDGAWEALDTVIALAVATILWCVTWPRKSETFTARWAVAHALVYGLIAGTGVAWVVQGIRGWPADLSEAAACSPWWTYSDPDCMGLSMELEAPASQATTIALSFALAVAVVVFFVLHRTRLMNKPPQQASSSR